MHLVKEAREFYPSQRALTHSVAPRIGCTNQPLRSRVTQSELGQRKRAGLAPDERELLKRLERQNWELKSANEILTMASTFFAQTDLYRKFK